MSRKSARHDSGHVPVFLRAISLATLGVVSAGLIYFSGDLTKAVPQLGEPHTNTIQITERRDQVICPSGIKVDSAGGIQTSDIGIDPGQTTTTLNAWFKGQGVSGNVFGFLNSGSETARLNLPNEGRSTIGPIDEPLGVQAHGEINQLAATTVTTATGSSALGISAVACQTPSLEQWLVGGSTTLGSSSELVIQNPSQTPVTVKVELWGANGKLTLAAQDTYLVPANQELSTLLEGLSAEQRRLVVKVSASGGMVTSYLKTINQSGLTPQGGSYVTAGLGLAQEHILPGVYVEEGDIGDSTTGAIRLLSPEVSTSAHIAIFDAKGQHVLRGYQTVPLVAGAVNDFSLGGLPKGTYTIVVTGDKPILAGAQAVRDGQMSADRFIGQPVDRAWIASTAGSLQGATVVLPSGVWNSLSVGVFPADVQGVNEGLDAVPIVYENPADMDSDLVANWKGQNVADLVIYDASGQEAKRETISLADFQSRVYELSTYAAGIDVAAVRLEPKSDYLTENNLVLAWSVSLSSQEVAQSLTTIQPVLNQDSITDLTVRRSPKLGVG